MAQKTIKSDENVFEALGFGEEEASNLKIRAELMDQLDDLIKKQNWTQEQAAKAMNVSQPRVSDLVNGRIDKFTIDTLIKMLSVFGRKVEIKVKRQKGLTVVNGGRAHSQRKKPKVTRRSGTPILKEA